MTRGSKHSDLSRETSAAAGPGKAGTLLRRFIAKCATDCIWTSLGLGVLYVVALLISARAIGYSRDESFYFDAANRYWGWVKLLFEHRDAALTRNVIDSHFVVNHEHPPLLKTLFGLSHELFYAQHRLFSYPGLSYRFPSMVIAGLGVVVLIQWGSRAVSRTGGLVAGLSFAVLPRVFHHAHLACFDVPVACLCLWSAYLWSRALESGKLRWSLALGLVYGLTLATKHNAWLLPPAFFVHGLCVKGGTFMRSNWLCRLKLLRPALSLLTLGPLVLFALWPWLWFETWERLAAWFHFHMSHEYYNMEFLGFTYWKPPMPLSYAWVMTLATVPLTTLVLFLLGGFYGTRDMLLGFLGRLQSIPGKLASPEAFSDVLLWSLCLLIFYSPWLSSDTPIFGGTKHWFTAYPFVCLFAGRGFESLRTVLSRSLPERFREPKNLAWITGLFVVAVVMPGLVTVWDMGPWGLSTYMPVVGGASGAATLGLNRTFWGYTTISLASALTTRAPGRVYLHDMTPSAWNMHTQDGAWPKSLYGTMSLTDSDLAVYHHEPHMERVEYQIWAAYGTSTPVAIGSYEGVPVVWLFERNRGNP